MTMSNAWWHPSTISGRCTAGVVLCTISGMVGTVAATTVSGWHIVVIACVLEGAVAAILCLTSLRPLGERLGGLRQALSSLSDDDLTVRLAKLHAGSPQLAALEDAYNRAAASLHDVLGVVAHVARSLSAQWREVGEIGADLSDTAEQTVNETLSAHEAAALVAQNMQVVASANEELAATVREIAASAADAATTADVAVANAHTAELSAAALREGAAALTHSCDVIAQLAKQTKLLALNARIEASHSQGDNGGFVVVADEVRALAGNSAEANELIRSRSEEMASGTAVVTESLDTIARDLARVSQKQSAIASAVEQQLSATREITHVAAATAAGSARITDNLRRLSHVMRRIAYGGSQARNTASQLAELDNELSSVLGRFTLTACRESEAETVAHAAFEQDGVLVIRSDVVGGLNAFEYTGTWCHSAKNEMSGASDAYTSMPDDLATVRCVGREVALYGVRDAHHGMAVISLDGGDETTVDLYASTRQVERVWLSGRLEHGEHTLRIRVADEKNPGSRYYWCAIDRVEVT